MKRRLSLSLATVGLAVIPFFLIDSPVHGLTVSIAAVCLMLWITEAVPPFVPTLLLWAAIPALLGRLDPEFGIQKVLPWAADPVVGLFFGGFVLGAAAEKSGMARRLMDFTLVKAGGSYGRSLLAIIAVTAFLSMWMSNIAAAALVLACIRPVLSGLDTDDILRRLLLLAVALGADFGGIATPIGTGPNAIAIASLSRTQPVTFLTWMTFAFPLMVGMIAASYFLLIWRLPAEARDAKISVGAASAENTGNGSSGAAVRTFVLVLLATVLLWLTEPVHGVPSAVISLAAACSVFALGILKKGDLRSIDWSTLILIAGGITLGRLLEQSGVVRDLSAQVPFHIFDPTLSLFLLCLAAAVLSALMSNTATAVLLIPLASAIIPDHSTPILIAIAASFGIPLVISTPPNAMAFGEGGLRFGDLFWVGVVLMIGGCLLISLTGPAVLRLVGIG